MISIPSGADNKLAAATKTGYSTGKLFMLPEDVPAVPSLVALSTMAIAQEMRTALGNVGLFRAGRIECGACQRADCPALKSRSGVCCIAQANRECPACGQKGHDRGCMRCGGKGEGAGLACCTYFECCKRSR